MTQQYDIKAMADKVRVLRQNAEELKAISGGIPTVDRNVDRILANVRILEISVSDVVEMLGE